MSVAVSRRCFTAGGLTLALVLSSPLAALADPQDRGRSGAAHDSRGHSAPQSSGARPSPTPSATPAEATPTGDERHRSRGERSGAKSGKGKGEGGPAGRRGQGRGAAGTPEARSAGDQDPRGNNGTIKVDGVAFDDSKGNEPHVGCEVRLVFLGFDAGDTASITLTGQAPTGGGLLHSETGTLISRDAAGGGQDLDEALVFSVDGALSELRSIAPHPQQGWHVKVAVDVDGAPGGAKQKVFWMSCPTTAAGAAAATTSPSPAPVGAAGVSGTTVSGTTVTPARGAQQGAAAPAAPELTLGSGALEVTEQSATADTGGGAASSGSAAAAGGVSARAADRPAALPFTGPVALGLLTALGLGSVVAGGAAHRLGRRREVQAPTS